jgi:hypothetical protein
LIRTMYTKILGRMQEQDSVKSARMDNVALVVTLWGTSMHYVALASLERSKGESVVKETKARPDIEKQVVVVKRLEYLPIGTEPRAQC